MLQEGLSYPTKGEEWPGRIAIGGLLAYVSVLLVPLIPLYGYQVRVLSSTAEGERIPPDFEDWIGMSVDGLKAIVVSFAYVGVPNLILGGVVVAAFATIGGLGLSEVADPAAVAGVGGVTLLVLGAVVLLVEAVVFYLLPAALTNFAADGSVRSAFALRSVGGLAFTLPYLLAFLLPPVVGAVVLVLSSTVVGTVLAPAFAFWGSLAVTRMYGIAYREVHDVRVEPATAAARSPSTGDATGAATDPTTDDRPVEGTEARTGAGREDSSVPESATGSTPTADESDPGGTPGTGESEPGSTPATGESGAGTRDDDEPERGSPPADRRRSAADDTTGRRRSDDEAVGRGRSATDAADDRAGRRGASGRTADEDRTGTGRSGDESGGRSDDEDRTGTGRSGDESGGRSDDAGRGRRSGRRRRTGDGPTGGSSGRERGGEDPRPRSGRTGEESGAERDRTDRDRTREGSNRRRDRTAGSDRPERDGSDAGEWERPFDGDESEGDGGSDPGETDPDDDRRTDDERDRTDDDPDTRR